MPVFVQSMGFGAPLESDLARATLLPAWQLLPLIPGTSGPEDCSKSDTCLQRKNVEVYILNMQK